MLDAVPRPPPPRDEVSREELLRAVETATLAPSSHNSQPWRFRVVPGEVEVYADRARALTVVDPTDRELTISCGAALHHLRLALQARGLTAHAVLTPDVDARDLLARVTVTPGAAPTPDERALYEAIPQRHTNRQRYLGMPVPDDVAAALARAAEEEGAYLVRLDDEGARARLAALVMEGDRLQWDDARFRRELAAWLRPNHAATGDGLPGYVSGHGDLAAMFAPLVVRTFDMGSGQAARDRDLVDASPLIAVFVTDGDGVRDWLRVGQALSRALLVATIEGIAASFLNQPIEVGELRPLMRELVGRQGHSQLVVRMGYAPPAPATPRRPLRDVVL